jgi:cysteinyl-tRNA synthetase
MSICGRPVDNYAHRGNSRPYLSQDVLAHILEIDGYNPYVVGNITDVDDKQFVIQRKIRLHLKILRKSGQKFQRKL